MVISEQQPRTEIRPGAAVSVKHNRGTMHTVKAAKQMDVKINAVEERKFRRKGWLLWAEFMTVEILIFLGGLCF